MMECIVEDSPRVTIDENIENLRYSQVCCNADIFPEIPLEKPTEQHIPSDPIEYVQKVSLIEDNIEDPLHDIITEAYKETYDKISMVCGDTKPCSPHVMKVWKVYCLVNFFLKKIVMNTRKTWIGRSMMPWMKSPPHMTWMGVMTIGVS